MHELLFYTHWMLGGTFHAIQQAAFLQVFSHCLNIHLQHTTALNLAKTHYLKDFQTLFVLLLVDDDPFFMFIKPVTGVSTWILDTRLEITFGSVLILVTTSFTCHTQSVMTSTWKYDF